MWCDLHHFQVVDACILDYSNIHKDYSHCTENNFILLDYIEQSLLTITRNTCSTGN